MVVAGANARADPHAVPDAVLTNEAVLVLQQEVDVGANATLIARARRAGARIVLNAAPAHAVSLELLRRLDMLIVNEAEASALATALGWAGTHRDFATRARAASPDLAVVVTLGAAGALWRGPDATLRARHRNPRGGYNRSRRCLRRRARGGTRRRRCPNDRPATWRRCRLPCVHRSRRPTGAAHAGGDRRVVTFGYSRVRVTLLQLCIRHHPSRSC